MLKEKGDRGIHNKDEMENFLYDHLRLALTREDNLRGQLTAIREQSEKKTQSVNDFKIEMEDLKKKNGKLKKKVQELLQIESQQIKIIHKAQSSS